MCRAVEKGTLHRKADVGVLCRAQGRREQGRLKEPSSPENKGLVSFLPITIQMVWSNSALVSYGDLTQLVRETQNSNTGHCR